MSARAALPPDVIFTDQAPVFEAIADAFDTARTYAETGVRFAEVRDAKAVAYSARAASAALLAAADLIEQVRPARKQGGRAA